MLVYTPFLHPRLEYTLRWLFSFPGEDLHVTTEASLFTAEVGPRLWYCNEPCPVPQAIAVAPVNVLWNNELKALNPPVCYRNTMAYPDLDGSGRFDPVAACFFVLSRYEEYAATVFDRHGRFSGLQAWGGPEIVKRPWADLWRKELHDALRGLYPTYQPSIPAFRCVASIDVDSAFAFRYKGVRRTMGGFAQDLLRLQPTRALNRLKCVLADLHDPFDTYEYILDTCLAAHVELRCFFLLADPSDFDINVDFRNVQLRERIEDMRDGGAIVGIHPGYQSHRDVRLLAKEIARLETILGQRVHHSRQHYLKFKLPQSYNRLLDCGITDDHSMGYADVPGFRAGTAHPFKWFDASANCVTTLRVYPLAVMDSTLHTYLGLDTVQAIKTIQQLKLEVRSVGGDFVSLWHNETVAEQGLWVGWRAVWEEAIKP